MGKDLETVDIPGIEILAPGTWKGNKTVTITDADIPLFVEAFAELIGNTELNYEPPVKLGHDVNQKLLQADGYPAAGWVSALKTVGNKLVADLKGVPAKLGAIIKAGGYKKVSAEFYQNHELGGKTFPWVLKAISLLGADVPAVKTIQDIQAMYSDEEQPVIVFYEVEGEQQETTEAPAANEAIEGNEKEQEETMEKEIRELLNLSEEDDVLAAVKTLSEKQDTNDQAVSLEEYQATAARVAVLETTLAERDRDERVRRAIESGKITPAQKEWADTYALSDPSGFDSFVETAPKVVEFGEVGAPGGDVTDIELTADEIKLGEQMGLTKEDLINAKKQEVD